MWLPIAIILSFCLVIEPILASNLNHFSTEEFSQQLFNGGRYIEAAEYLQKLIRDYESQGAVIPQLLSLRNLALTYQKLARWQEATQVLQKAQLILEKISSSNVKKKLSAQMLDVQGQIELSKGQPEQALETWRRAGEIYKQLYSSTDTIRNQIQQVKALKSLGSYGQAIKILNKCASLVDEEIDSRVKHETLLNLGDLYRSSGQWDKSLNSLLKSERIAVQINDSELLAQSYLSLAHFYRFQGNSIKAFQYYKLAENSSSSLYLEINAQINQLALIERDKNRRAFDAIKNSIEEKLIDMPNTHAVAYAYISFARVVQKSSMNQPQSYDTTLKLLRKALNISTSLDDGRTRAMVLGALGSLYEASQQWSEAKQLTQQALASLQSLNAPEISYQLNWQLARISLRNSDFIKAKTAYSVAINELQSLRNDITSSSSEIQLSFRDSVEPLYRQYVSLLLRDKPTQSNLREARNVIELLQLAELDNFFRDACLDLKPVQIDSLDSRAAIIYPVLLEDRLEVIVRFSGERLNHYTVSINRDTIESTLAELQVNLAAPQQEPYLRRFKLLSERFYNWLIRPIESEIESHRVQHVIFVPDGVLRSLPFASLYDGQQYLVQKYGVALAPSLQLIDPKPITKSRLQILSAGLTEERDSFPPLPYVGLELKTIQAVANSKVLVNQSFTESSLVDSMSKYKSQVVHLATHGQFSSRSQETFFLTWDGKVDISELNSLLRADRQQIYPVELLVLSACQTALGDKYAALGLAGVAVRAGARSTLASLWSVSDEATSELMKSFYNELVSRKVPKLQALRVAQMTLIDHPRFSHPFYWSAFVLLGNWL
jgi:CHAT domain-containing protein